MTNLTQILTTLPKGAFFRAAWGKTLKTRKGTVSVVRKETSGVFRFGVSYDAIRDVKEGRENGTLPTENAGLPWGEWEVFPFTILHKETRYIRVYLAAGEDSKLERVRSRYFINGVEATKEEAKALCLASEFPAEKPDEVINCFTVKEENFTELGPWKKED